MPADDAYDVGEVTDLAEWDAFAATAQGGTPFSTTPWLDCAAAGNGRVRLIGCRRKGRLVAGVSGLEVPARGGRQLVTPPLLPHGGFLLAPPNSDRAALQEAERGGAFRALIQFLELEFGAVHLTHAPALSDTREFAWAGWAVRPRYTYQIDLADRQAVWDTMERRTRGTIRKAGEAGFRLVPADDDGLLRDLYQAVYERQEDGPPMAATAVEAVAHQARAAGLTETWAVESPAGEPAAIVTFTRSDPCYALIAGAAPAFRDTGATALLYWEFLQRAEARRFDFAGANMPAIALFKRGFGGTLVPYFAVDGYRGRLRRSLAALRRAWP